MNVCTYICIMKLEEALRTNNFLDLRHKASLNVLYTSYWLKTEFSQAIKSMNLTMEQFNILRILKGSHPRHMCVKDIASRMLEKSSNVPRIVDRLLLKGLVERTTSEEDKRETLVSLTEKGCLELEKANGLVDSLYTGIIGINESEAEQLNNLLEKMRVKE